MINEERSSIDMRRLQDTANVLRSFISSSSNFPLYFIKIRKQDLSMKSKVEKRGLPQYLWLHRYFSPSCIRINIKTECKHVMEMKVELKKLHFKTPSGKRDIAKRRLKTFVEIFAETSKSEIRLEDFKSDDSLFCNEAARKAFTKFQKFDL